MAEFRIFNSEITEGKVLNYNIFGVKKWLNLEFLTQK
jgi:hypothetical protein